MKMLCEKMSMKDTYKYLHTHPQWKLATDRDFRYYLRANKKKDIGSGTKKVISIWTECGFEGKNAIIHIDGDIKKYCANRNHLLNVLLIKK